MQIVRLESVRAGKLWVLSVRRRGWVMDCTFEDDKKRQNAPAMWRQGHNAGAFFET